MAQDASARQCVIEVTRLLTAVGDALASGDTNALLAHELRLPDAVVSLSSATHAHPDEVQALVADIRQAQRALVRCRTLGRATTELVAASLAAQGVAPGYQPAGAGAALPRLGRVAARV